MNTKMLHSKIFLITFSLIIALTLAYPNPNYPASSDKQKFLDAHNKARAEIGVNMQELTWNDTVAGYALGYAQQSISQQCTYDLKHSDGPYGENLALAMGSDLSATDAVAMWVNERNDYDYGSNQCVGGKMCGHYTQVVWSQSTQLGCARVPCTDESGVFVICSYNPPGNYIGERPY